MKVDDEERHLFVVPKEMRKVFAVKYHDQMGHFGLDRSMAKLLKYFWFPGARRYMRQHIEIYLECLMYKKRAGKKHGLLNPIPPGRRPFEVIHMDHLGPFVKSLKKNKELLVVIDNLTRFVTLYPMRDTKTRNVMKALEDLVTRRGLLRTIITDRGTCFTAKNFEDFCLKNGIRHVLNSCRHPQANGMVERVNRTLLPILAISSDDPEGRD